MLEPIPFWGMIEVDLPVKTHAGNRPNYVIDSLMYEVLNVIKDHQEDQNPQYKEYENTYLDGWQDACNEIYWAIEKLLEKAQEK